jgi:DNA-binding transcriptional LysR family regulator
MAVAMELRQLRMFVAVAEEAGFSRAADRLHVVQSAVSAGIRSLERELGTPLFHRDTRHVELSDAGRALLPEARHVLSAVALAADSVAQVGSGLRGSVTLGTMQAQGMRRVSTARLIAAFQREHPGVRISARHVGGSTEMARQVDEGGLDLGILSLVDRASTGLELTRLAGEPMFLACAPAHPLAGAETVSLVELAAERFVDMPEGWGVRMATDRAFAAAGVARTVSFELNDSASVIEFVREGLGVALLPGPMATIAPEVHQIPIAEGAPSFEIFLAEPTGRRRSAAATAFGATIRAQF